MPGDDVTQIYHAYQSSLTKNRSCLACDRWAETSLWNGPSVQHFINYSSWHLSVTVHHVSDTYPIFLFWFPIYMTCSISFTLLHTNEDKSLTYTPISVFSRNSYFLVWSLFSRSLQHKTAK